MNDERLASLVLGEMAGVYKTNMDTRQREENAIYVLDRSVCPSVLLECGYINNSADLAFFIDPKNQEKIARAILSGIVKYSKEPTTPAKIDPITGDTTHSLIIIDGKEKPGLTLDDLARQFWDNDIDSALANFLNAKDAIAKYGDKGKNGVIEITTKKKSPVKVDEIVIKPDAGPSVNDNKLFEKVEIEASFPGGAGAWTKFLERNLDADVAVKNNAPPGQYTVYVQFIVHQDGSLTDIIPLTKHGFGMEQEAIRIISKGPHWVPAVQNGHTVSAYKKQRVDFQVGQNTKPISIYNNTQLRSTSPKNMMLDPRKLYIGIDNSLVARSDGMNAEGVDATISQGKIRKEGDDFIVNVNSAGIVTIHFYSIEDGRKIDLKDINFNVEAVPVPQPVSGSIISNEKRSTDNEIRVSDLKKATIYDLLRLDPSTEVVSFTLTIDVDKDVAESKNTGSRFSEQTNNLLQQTTPGHMFTIEDILINKDNVEKKLPARFYFVVD